MYVVGQNILAFGAVPAGAAAGAGVGGAVGAVPGAAVGAAAGTVAGGAAGVAFSAIAALGETDSYVHAAVSVAFDVKIAAMLVDLIGALLGKLSKLLGEAAETGAKRVVEEGERRPKQRPSAKAVRRPRPSPPKPRPSEPPPKQPATPPPPPSIRRLHAWYDDGWGCY